ncbi:hypothetical protein BCON_0026g00190 [Botryotinia convoluta]|uniref:Uncharacterized protein n=1 Tax=Botryotinia convoluta TaxID=54673 RepID=A0A4Z1IJJ2_9HELO|nr:hypothetical protein BCON_0026g00190 [Botryotinia convoluta]
MLLYSRCHLPIYEIARLYINSAKHFQKNKRKGIILITMFRTIDNLATGTNPDDRVKKLEAQVAELQKTVEDLQKRLVEIEKTGDVEELDLMKILEQAGFDTNLPEPEPSAEKPEELQME